MSNIKYAEKLTEVVKEICPDVQVTGYWERNWKDDSIIEDKSLGLTFDTEAFVLELRYTNRNTDIELTLYKPYNKEKPDYRVNVRMDDFDIDFNKYRQAMYRRNGNPIGRIYNHSCCYEQSEIIMKDRKYFLKLKEALNILVIQHNDELAEQERLRKKQIEECKIIENHRIVSLLDDDIIEMDGFECGCIEPTITGYQCNYIVKKNSSIDLLNKFSFNMQYSLDENDKIIKTLVYIHPSYIEIDDDSLEIRRSAVKKVLKKIIIEDKYPINDDEYKYASSIEMSVDYKLKPEIVCGWLNKLNNNLNKLIELYNNMTGENDG